MKKLILYYSMLFDQKTGELLHLSCNECGHDHTHDYKRINHYNPALCGVYRDNDCVLIIDDDGDLVCPRHEDVVNLTQIVRWTECGLRCPECENGQLESSCDCDDIEGCSCDPDLSCDSCFFSERESSMSYMPSDLSCPLCEHSECGGDLVINAPDVDSSPAPAIYRIASESLEVSDSSVSLIFEFISFIENQIISENQRLEIEIPTFKHLSQKMIEKNIKDFLFQNNFFKSSLASESQEILKNIVQHLLDLEDQEKKDIETSRRYSLEFQKNEQESACEQLNNRFPKLEKLLKQAKETKKCSPELFRIFKKITSRHHVYNHDNFIKNKKLIISWKFYFSAQWQRNEDVIDLDFLPDSIIRNMANGLPFRQ